MILPPGIGGSVAGGIAGVISAEVDASLGPVGISGQVTVRINKTGVAIDETINVGGRSIAIHFGPQEGDVFDISVSNASIKIGGFVSIEGSVAFTTIGDRATFAGDGLDIFLGQGPARLDNGDINPLASGVLLSDARIGLVKLTSAAGDTFALHAEGTVQLLGIEGVTIRGTAVVDFNDTALVINESLSVGDSTIDVSFASADDVALFQALDVELDVLGEVLRGNFAFDQAVDPISGEATLRIAASGVDIVLGGGVVAINDASGSFIATPAGIAASLAGDVSVAVPGVEFDGNFEVAINTTGALVDEVLMVGNEVLALELPAGPFLRVAGTGVNLTIAGQTLSGDFAIEQVTRLDGSLTTTIAASNVSLSLSAGNAPIVILSDGFGLFVVTDLGIAGSLGGSVAAAVPGVDVSFSGTFTVEINNTNQAVSQEFFVAGAPFTLELPRGPPIRVVGTDVELRIAGQVLAGDFLFERVTTAATTPTNVVRIALTNISIDLGDGLVTVQNGAGALFISNDGITNTIAGQFSTDVGIDIPGISLTGTFGVAVNTGSTAVNETFLVGATPVTIDVQAGPFLAVSATGALLDVLGQQIGGDFRIESETDPLTGASNLTIIIENGFLNLGGASPVVEVSNLNGLFLVTPLGVAGITSAEVAVNIPGVSLDGTFEVQLNTVTAPVSNGFGTLPAGPFLRVAGSNIELTVFGQTLTGDFAFEQFTRADGSAIVRVAAANVGLNLAGVVVVSNGAGFFVITPAGIAGELSATVSLNNVPDVSFSGTFGVQLNNTGIAINESIQVGAGVSTLALPAGPFLRVTGDDIILSVAGQTLRGNFAFEQFTRADGSIFVRAGTNGVSLAIGDGANDILTLTNGAGSLVILPDDAATAGVDESGIAGSFSGDVTIDIPGVSLSATLTVNLNQTAAAISESFVVGGTATTLELPAGNFFEVVGEDIELVIAGQTLSGNFTFRQSTETIDLGAGASAQSVLFISFSEVELGLGDGTTDFVRVNAEPRTWALGSGGTGAFTPDSERPLRPCNHRAN